MTSTRRPRSFGGIRLTVVGLAMAVALAGCQGDSQEASSTPPENPPVAAGAAAPGSEGQVAGPQTQGGDPDTQIIDTPEEKAMLAKELADSRRKAQDRQQPVDPELEKRMKDPEYRKQKDAMLNKLSQVSTAYFKKGIEIRHTRKRPEWRLIDPSLAEVTNEAERRQKGEALAKKFKSEVEPVLSKTIGVVVYADASESIQVY